MHKQIRQLTGQKTCLSTGWIKSKDGTFILEKGKVLQRWNEYIGEQPSIHRTTDGPDILKTEVEAAMTKLNRDKERDIHAQNVIRKSNTNSA